MIVKALLKSQQLVLKEAGFYTGPIDGFWTPECSQAMRSLAYLGTGTQTHGNPYCTGNNLPSGYVWAEVDGQPIVAVNEGQDLGEKFVSRFREICGEPSEQKISPASPAAPKVQKASPKAAERPAPQNMQDVQTPSFTSAPAPEATAKRSAEQSEGQARSGKSK